MKKVTKQILACLLTVTLISLGLTGCTQKEKTSTGSEQTEEQTKETTTARTADPDGKTHKDETVYVIANADGSAGKIIVSNWISNATAEKTITDKSNLSGIQNVKGNETYTVDGENAIVWDAQGDDIYYQGTSDSALPVNMTVSYQLDGKAISAKDLAGKSGRVTIRFDYQNTQYETVTINGKSVKVYVPYVMLTGMVLKNDTFQNISVTNGKLINDGNSTYVAGFAFPGLQESLGIDEKDMKIPSYVELSADTTDFSLSTTVTIASSELLQMIDTDPIDSKLTSLRGSLDQLSDAMTKLMDGSSTLYNGMKTLLDSSSQLVDGVQQLANGAKSVYDGTDTLSQGAASLASNLAGLKNGAASLSDGLGTLKANNNSLNTGAETVFNTLLGTAKDQLDAEGITVAPLTIENYKTVLNGLVNTPSDEQKAQLIAIAKAELNTQLVSVPTAYQNAAMVMLYDMMSTGTDETTAIATMTAKLTDAGTVSAIAASSVPPDPDVYAYLTANHIDATTAGLLAKICAYLAATNGGTAVSYINTASAMATNATAVATAAADPNTTTKINALCLSLALKSLQPAVKALLEQLDSYHTFYTGLLSYTAGVASASDGAKQLADGSSQLAAGASQLSAGASDLKTGSKQLYDGLKTLLDQCGKLKTGISKLKDGSMQLSSGLKQFNTDGVQKIEDLYKNDISELITRTKAMVKAAKDHQTFSGTADGVDSSVRYIYKTEEISK